MQTNEGGIFNFRFALFSAIYLALGVVFCYYHYFLSLHTAWLLCLPPMAFFPAFLSFSLQQWKKIAALSLLLCVSFFIGLFGFQIEVNRYEDARAFGECYFSGKVVEMRDSANGTQVILGDLTIEGEKQNCKLIAYLPASLEGEVGLCDELFLRGTVTQKSFSQETFTLNASDFGKRIFLSAREVEGEKIGHSFDLFLFLNGRAKARIDAGMDETPAAVTRAVLLGDTTAIDKGLYDNIRRGGISHIFAVSGLHVGSLFAFCLLLVKKTSLRRMGEGLRFTFVAGILLTYAGVCAFTASVVRATVICLFAYAGKLLLVKTDFLQSLGLAAICILIVQPSALFTVGFQLSFAACFGIAFLSKPIGQVFDEGAKLYRKFVPIKLTEAEQQALENDDTIPPRIPARIYRILSSFMATSLAAQLFTAPLLLQYFGYVSGWALLLNCIFVPFISIVFSWLFLFVLLACILPTGLEAVLLYLPNAVWSAVLLLFERFDFSSFALKGISISSGLSMVYIAVCLFFTDKWNLKKSTQFLLAGVCIFAFVAGMVALNV